MSGLGVELDGRIIHPDQDSVYTSYQWLRTILPEDGMRVSYSENGDLDLQEQRTTEEIPDLQDRIALEANENRDWITDRRGPVLVGSARGP
jgi:hypothetical protein